MHYRPQLKLCVLPQFNKSMTSEATKLDLCLLVQKHVQHWQYQSGSVASCRSCLGRVLPGINVYYRCGCRCGHSEDEKLCGNPNELICGTVSADDDVRGNAVAASLEVVPKTWAWMSFNV